MFKCCYSLHNTEIRESAETIQLQFCTRGTSWRAGRHTRPSCSSYLQASPEKAWYFSAFPCHVTSLQVTMNQALLAAAPSNVQWTGPSLLDHRHDNARQTPEKKCEMTSAAGITQMYPGVRGNTVKNSWKKKFILGQGCPLSWWMVFRLYCSSLPVGQRPNRLLW